MKKYSNIAIIVGILLFIYGFINYSLNQLWDWVSTVSVILGVIVAVVGIYYRFQIREKKISKRTVQYGTNMVLSVVVMLGIIILVAFISNRHHVRADLTKQGLYSLSEQTKSVLNNLNKEVEITGFYKQSDEMMAKDLFGEYAYRSRFIKYQFVDPNQKPQLARQYNVTKYNTVVVSSGAKRENIDDLNESTLTNAIMKVTRDLDKVIYFTTGHGEKDISSNEPQGYKVASDGIRNENYQLKTINLAVEKSIPKDCSVLVIAGPRADFFQSELDTIKAYVDNGGKLMALIDPEWKPALVNFLKNYKIDVGNNIVVDASGVGQLFGMGPEIPLVSKYSDSEIFKNFSTMTFYPQACSVEAGSEGESGFTPQVLFSSSPSSWAETDYKQSQVKFDEGTDLKGPVPLAVVSTKTLAKGDKAAVMVIGDSDFADNAYIKNSGNYDAFLNEINWLAEEQDMITIRPKEINDQRINLTAKQSKIILYVSVFALPLMVIVAGVFVYYRRRR